MKRVYTLVKAYAMSQVVRVSDLTMGLRAAAVLTGCPRSSVDGANPAKDVRQQVASSDVRTAVLAL